MKAQTLYDFVEKYGVCSGTDLHEFFRAEVGDPSPRGRAKIGEAQATDFVIGCLLRMEAHSPTLADHCKKARIAWKETR